MAMKRGLIVALMVVVDLAVAFHLRATSSRRLPMLAMSQSTGSGGRGEQHNHDPVAVMPPLNRRQLLHTTAAATIAGVATLAVASSSVPPAAAAAAAATSASSGSGSTVPAAAAVEAAVDVGAWKTFISGAASGAAVRVTKQLTLYPIETVKARIQVASKSKRKITPDLFKNLYDGVLPPLVLGIPAGSVFFAVKDLMKEELAGRFGSSGSTKIWTTIAAVGVANLPYWVLLTPPDMVKTRQQTGLAARGAIREMRRILDEEGIGEYLKSYYFNVAYAFPADALKFVVYEKLKRDARAQKGGGKLSTVEAAVVGAVATMISQAASTPLDVIRTRVMTQGAKERGEAAAALASSSAPSTAATPTAAVKASSLSGSTTPDAADAAVVQGGGERYEGMGDAVRKIVDGEGWQALFLGLTPRLVRAVVSGAVQFGSYEAVKNLFGVDSKKD